MNEMSSSICLQPNGVWHDHVKKVAQVANWSVSLSVTDSSAVALLTAVLSAPCTFGWIKTEAASKGPYSVESEWRREDYFPAGFVTFKCMRTISASILAPPMGADDHLPPRRIQITAFSGCVSSQHRCAPGPRPRAALFTALPDLQPLIEDSFQPDQTRSRWPVRGTSVNSGKKSHWRVSGRPCECMLMYVWPLTCTNTRKRTTSVLAVG